MRGRDRDLDLVPGGLLSPLPDGGIKSPAERRRRRRIQQLARMGYFNPVPAGVASPGQWRPGQLREDLRPPRVPVRRVGRRG